MIKNVKILKIFFILLKFENLYKLINVVTKFY